MKKIVTFGEIMLRLGAPDYLRLTQCNQLDMTYAGAEANVAVSLANYGLPVHYITCLPNNPIAEKCLSELRGQKVNVDSCITSGNRMGILYIEKGAVSRPSRVFYDRAGSSFSEVSPTMIPWREIFKETQWFHWTGITPALSQTAADTLLEALQIANEMGVTVSCDLNYRGNLWQYGKQAKDVMPKLVSYTDIILGNEEDCEKVFGIKAEGFDANKTEGKIDSLPFESVCTQMMELFPRCKKMIITLRGAINANHNTWSGVLYSDNILKVSKSYNITDIVDRVGGGDSFMGGLIYGLITYPQDDQKALEFAVAASCLKHTIFGDYNLVSIQEVENLMNGDSSGRIKR